MRRRERALERERGGGRESVREREGERERERVRERERERVRERERESERERERERALRRADSLLSPVAEDRYVIYIITVQPLPSSSFVSPFERGFKFTLLCSRFGTRLRTEDSEPVSLFLTC